MPFKFQKAFLFISAMLLGMASHAQMQTVKNLNKFDQKKIHFGFLLGINTADFRMQNDLSKTDSLLSLETRRQSGFNLGIISDLHLHPNLSLRFIPTLSFGERRLEYTFLRPDSTTRLVEKPVESTWLDFPLLFKFRSDRLNNFAAYVVAGGRYSLDLASQDDVDQSFTDDIIVPINRHNYAFEVGFGTDFFLEYFKFSPEFRLVVGTNNLVINDGTPFSSPIDVLRSRIFLISFNFEG